MNKAEFLLALFTLAAVGLVVVLFVYFPVSYMRLVVEDSFVEFATFLTYIVAAAFFLARFLRQVGQRAFGLLLFALGCFVLGMEEISWGQRLLAFESGEYFAEHNKQGEANLHNLFNHRAFMAVFSLAVLSWVILYPLLLRLNISVLSRLQAGLSLPLVPTALWPCFVIVLAMLVWDYPARGEEVYEWFLSVLFLSVAYGPDFSARGKIMVLLSITVLAVVLAVRFFQPDTYERGLQRLSLKHYSRMDMCRQALLVRSELESRGVAGVEAQVIRLSLERRAGLLSDPASAATAVTGAFNKSQLHAARGDLEAARQALGSPFGPGLSKGVTEHNLLKVTQLHLALKNYEFARYLIDNVQPSSISPQTGKALNVLGKKVANRSRRDEAGPAGLFANCSS